MRAPKRRIRIVNGYTVLVVFYEVGGVPKGTRVIKRPECKRALYRGKGGKEACIRRFRWRVGSTSSTLREQRLQALV